MTTEYTDATIYAVMEYRPDRIDAVRMLVGDDASEVAETLEHINRLVESDAGIAPNRIHAADPGEPYLDPGDWYLCKYHGVPVSHGLVKQVQEKRL